MVISGRTKAPKTALEKQMQHVRRRRGDRRLHLRDERGDGGPVTLRGSGEEHVIDTPFQVMYIMANLSPEDTGPEEHRLHEQVLCTIKVRSV